MSRNAARAPDSHAAYMSSSVQASSGPVGTCCALLTSTSTPPNRSTAALTAASQSARARTSPATAIASAPSSSISLTVRAPVSASRSSTTMAAPAFANASAMPRPTPRPAPVTSATLPSSTASLTGIPRRLRRDRHRLAARQPVPPRGAQVVPLGEGGGVGLAEVLGCGPDVVGDGLERVDVEAVELGRVEPEDLPRLVDGDVVEGLAEDPLGVGPGALGVREVVAPHDVADADLEAARQLAAAGVLGSDLDVADEVLAREHREQAVHAVVELARSLVLEDERVGAPEQVGHP